MPEVFENLGVSFQYPENWRLDEEDALAGRDSVTIYSPGGGFWSVAVHPVSADPARLALAAVDAMRQEYESLEVEQIQETLAGCELIGYDLSFFYLDLTNSAQIRCLKASRATYSVFCQAEDREFDEVQNIFRAITCSLLTSVKQ